MSKNGKVVRRGRSGWRLFCRELWMRGLRALQSCWAWLSRWFPWRRLALVAASFLVVLVFWAYVLHRSPAPRLLELPAGNRGGYVKSPTEAQVTALARLEAEVTALRKQVSALSDREKGDKTATFDPSLFQRPVLGRVVRGMGWVTAGAEWSYHDGIDLMAGEGANVLAAAANVLAAADGTVTAVKNLPGLGTVVILTHGNGWESRYGHLQGIRVSPGQEVKAGTVLGTCSAKSCGENSGFHFSIYAKGQPVDPEGIIPGLGR